MKIAVVGTGYVGLVSGTCFAETGNHVTCVDINKEKVEQMKRGEIPIYEPHLDTMFERNINQGRLTFTTDLEEGIKDAKVICLALPTPPDGDGAADLRFILEVADQLGHLIKEYKVVVNKSTVPVGTAEKVHAAIAKNCKSEFDVVSNPEFLREGFAVDDFMKPDRVVIGTRSEKAKKIMTDLYAPFVRQGNPVYYMDERSAELTKYAANAFLATKISFMNEIANLCERTGANVDMVRIGLGADSRIGKRFLFAGIGYGGSCFPKDVQALAKTSSDYHYDFKILKSVMAVNQLQHQTIVDKIKKHFHNDIRNKKFALWGLAFKPDTDDIREAPALHIIDQLKKEGAVISAFDPQAMKNVQKSIGDSIHYGTDEYDVLKNADALIIATEWSLFRNPDFEKMISLMKSKTIFDGRNLYDLNQMKELDFSYYSVGRETVLRNKE
ncbi:MAG: UDP-glucose/GDP-mannose dehydrogenase family protein [Bacteroidetes bacterium]|nr:UDP-glucose/GDP-mannose dehydrogenase family protein [Bacteroidota bacterium]